MRSVEEIGGIVAAERLRKGLSREKLARMLASHGYETTEMALLTLEKARGQKIDVFLLLAISKALGLPFLELTGEKEMIAKPPAPIVQRFEAVVDKLGEAEVESHLRGLELLAQERGRKRKASA